ncbi:hypothetical protein [Spirosoma endophyticum]|uniref:Uncharacterized protein n=1 Tax=Spirosoma endophyticum TaxID=662367 RepID=A0A1I2EBN7_9BACT|nr:hypothetical protein [Spirosoma endophyticum]SFE89898.1 hypothetical protein SAMN05216167_12190 [Spirosoma endophyticum]
MIAPFLTALFLQGACPKFSYSLSAHLANFDLLNRVVAQGHSLLKAYVLEDAIRTDLPLAPFDGLQASTAICALE